MLALNGRDPLDQLAAFLLYFFEANEVEQLFVEGPVERVGVLGEGQLEQVRGLEELGAGNQVALSSGLRAQVEVGEGQLGIERRQEGLSNDIVEVGRYCQLAFCPWRPRCVKSFS